MAKGNMATRDKYKNQVNVHILKFIIQHGRSVGKEENKNWVEKFQTRVVCIILNWDGLLENITLNNTINNNKNK